MKLVYFLYLLKKTNFKYFSSLTKSLAKQTHRSYAAIVWEVFISFLKYNTAFLDYFYFKFHNKDKNERSSYADTLFMYRFQKKHNDSKYIDYFADKSKFHQRFKDYVAHKHFLPLNHSQTELEHWLLTNQPEHIIGKNSKGQIGSGIEKFEVDYSSDGILLNQKPIPAFLLYLQSEKMNLIEVFITQHDVLNTIYPKSVNTLRVITFLENENKVRFLGTILRMGAGKSVDNFDSGGVSAIVNLETGEVEGPVMYKDPNKVTDGKRHPTTGVAIVGVQLPFWSEIVDMVQRAAIEVPQVKTVGWDVVITPNGPSLLEGNHNWDKTHWQLCYQKGLKKSLENLDKSP